MEEEEEEEGVECTFFLGGVSTAILFSGFESYMVTHHHMCHFPSHLLGDTFQLAWGWNSIVAVMAGVITSTVVHYYSTYKLFPNTPPEVGAFDCSIVALLLAMIFILLQWEENYGDTTLNVTATIRKSIQAFRSNRKILLLGIIQSGFESSMYLCYVLNNIWSNIFIHTNNWLCSLTRRLRRRGGGGRESDIFFFFDIVVCEINFEMKIVVFMWSPTLEQVAGDSSRVDHGWIFANFMLCCLIGNDVYGGLTKQLNWSIEFICFILCLGSGMSPTNSSLHYYNPHKQSLCKQNML
ncbi:hypothetical protein RFI_24380 [Reticulomyxa filosa]|uniref:Uncharacterized protein n=1 Tax=Reticulomyxa filosa TaxID=46433 RepID=X6MH64_RETFI|nr:hypothetical protein RFI_24380 [Reticulomyxa filosa]|eukprot:ETO12996.1 hypothetical protein RFI_24380 [Reticulomyxa filosa]